MDGALPGTPKQWDKIIDANARELEIAATQEWLGKLSSNASLRLYTPCAWHFEGRRGINRFLHDSAVPVDAAVAAERFITGQDGCLLVCPACEARACPNPPRESAEHIIFDCPVYEGVRQNNSVALSELVARRDSCLFRLHRAAWAAFPWSTLRDAIYFWGRIARARAAYMKQLASNPNS